MLRRLFPYAALLLSIAIVVVGACGPQPAVVPSPSTTRAPTASATRTASVTASPTPSPSPSLSATASPAAVACQAASGGQAGSQAQLVAIRVAHQPGFDRVVFEFGPSTAPGSSGIPSYRIEPASSFRGTSGLAVPVSGNLFLAARFQNASTRNPDGTASYTGPDSIQPGTPLVREVKLVDDFERVMLWGIGLEKPTGLQELGCPRVSELVAPFRVVLDLPTPP